MIKILKSKYDYDLANMVNDLLAKGWKLHGSTFYADGQFCQVMIKEQ